MSKSVIDDTGVAGPGLLMSGVALCLSGGLAELVTAPGVGILIPFIALWAVMEVGIIAAMVVEEEFGEPLIHGIMFVVLAAAGAIIAGATQHFAGTGSTYETLAWSCWAVVLISYAINAIVQLMADPFS